MLATDANECLGIWTKGNRCDTKCQDVTTPPVSRVACDGLCVFVFLDAASTPKFQCMLRPDTTVNQVNQSINQIASKGFTICAEQRVL